MVWTATAPATDPRERYLSQFARQSAIAMGPPWLAERRDAAIERFRDVGFPTTRQEEWRFTDIAPLTQTPFTLPTSPGPKASPEAVEEAAE